MLILYSLKENGESLDVILKLNRQINPDYVFKQTGTLREVLQFLLNNKDMQNSAMIFAQNYDWEKLSVEDFESFQGLLVEVASSWFQEGFYIGTISNPKWQKIRDNKRIFYEYCLIWVHQGSALSTWLFKPA